MKLVIKDSTGSECTKDSSAAWRHGYSRENDRNIPPAVVGVGYRDVQNDISGNCCLGDSTSSKCYSHEDTP
jgi:hypothetical protein